MRIRDHSKQITMAMSNLSTHLIFLRYDWLKKHNPQIDWKAKTLQFTCENEHTPGLLDPEIDDEEVEPKQLFMMDYEYFRNPSTDIAIAAGESKQTKTFEEIVLEAYHEYKDIFAKEMFDELPLHRPWDYAIKLLPGNHKVDCKTYNLTTAEQKELDDFLEENLSTGRIQPSKSQFTSAFFFVKKKDSKLHPVQDYWKLNDIMVKNRYPLPLISELIDKLKNTKYYIKLDIQWGYNNIRMKEGDEWKAAFQTNRGLFEPWVMFFGLCNLPAIFQIMMNHIFCDLINKGKVIVYMDDIMIFTKTLNKHRQIIWEVLQILHENKQSLKHTKCDFETQETEYLGLIVSEGQIKMDPGKVKGVTNWPISKSHKELWGFLGFLNFYHWFIENFSKVAHLLNALTSEKLPFKWTAKCQMAFKQLKEKITMAPALCMPNNEDPFCIKTDGLGIGIGAILSQQQGDCWHPIAFISCSLNDAEWNYHAADLEMAAIIFALKEWRQYLLDTKHPFMILTDYKNLEYFTKPQDLSCWQAHWNQILQEYHYVIQHCPGKTNPADPLSWRPDFEKGVKDNIQIQILSPLKSEESSSMKILSERVDTRTKAQEKRKSLHLTMPEESSSTEILPERVNTQAMSLKQLEMIESMVTKNQFCTKKFIIEGLKLKDSLWYKKDNLIHWKTLLYIPPNPQLREQIIQQNHDHPLAGHPGIRHTLNLLKTWYYWPTIKWDIARYIKGCNKCQRVKTDTSGKKTLLNPNTVPDAPWKIILVDLIGPLPESKGKNAIMVIVNQFSKMIRLFPVSTKITSQGVAKIFRDEIFKLHGIPKKMISDRGPQFVLSFMKELYSQLQIEGNPSTAYHPETNGQTERINAWVE